MKTMNGKRAIALLLAALMLLSLCACGSAKQSAASGANYRPEEPAEDWDYAYDAAAEESGFASASAPTAMAAKAESGEENTEAPEIDPEKIIYSADVTVETTTFDDSVSQVEALIKGCGGWIESSSVNGANYYDNARGYSRNRSASYTLRVPSDRFQELMTQISSLGNVPYSHTYTENVTAQYYDVQARLTACKTQETRLLEMMELAKTVEDVIAIEERLSDLRYQIESLQSSLNNWDRRVSYSSIYLQLNEVQIYTPEPEKRISYGERLAGALRDGLEAVGDFFSGALLFLASVLPLLLVLAALVALIVWIIRKLRRRRKARKAAKLAVKAAPAPAPQKQEDPLE